MKIKVDMDFGSRLSALRRNCGLTQARVVLELHLRGCDLHPVAYSRMERNDYNIRISELMALRDIFGVQSYDEFFAELEPIDKNS